MPSRTPINIRGKKRNKSPPPDDVQPAAQKLCLAELSRKRARGPPIMRLPTELLEMIFLQTEGIALALASPVLGARLSHPYIRMLMTVAAFAETWDAYLCGCRDDIGILLRSPLLPVGNARFQVRPG